MRSKLLKRMDQRLAESDEIIEKVHTSDEYASDLYSALCNNQFYELSNTAHRWSCSWRYAAGLIARFRNAGTPMDWYASFNEGNISAEIMADINSIGWNVMPVLNIETEDWRRAQVSGHRESINLRHQTPLSGDFRIALVGEAGSGKDTVADIISEICPDAYRIAFADDLKLLAAQMINKFGRESGLSAIYFSEWDVDSFNPHKSLFRPFWQWVGTDLVRSKYPNYWINRVATRLNTNLFAKRIIITDCRFQNEAEWAKDNGFIVARLLGRDRIAPDHESERQIMEITPDVEYVNTGSIDDLRDWVIEMLLPRASPTLKRLIRE